MQTCLLKKWNELDIVLWVDIEDEDIDIKDEDV